MPTYIYTTFDTVKIFVYGTSALIGLICAIIILPRIWRKRFGKSSAGPAPDEKPARPKLSEPDAHDGIRSTINGIGSAIGIVILTFYKGCIIMGAFLVPFLVSMLILLFATLPYEATVTVVKPDFEAEYHKVLTWANQYGISEKGNYVCNRTTTPLTVGLAIRIKGLSATITDIKNRKEIPAGSTVRVSETPKIIVTDTTEIPFGYQGNSQPVVLPKSLSTHFPVADSTSTFNPIPEVYFGGEGQ